MLEPRRRDSDGRVDLVTCHCEDLSPEERTDVAWRSCVADALGLYKEDTSEVGFALRGFLKKRRIVGRGSIAGTARSRATLCRITRATVSRIATLFCGLFSQIGVVLLHRVRRNVLRRKKSKRLQNLRRLMTFDEASEFQVAFVPGGEYDRCVVAEHQPLDSRSRIAVCAADSIARSSD